MRGGTPGHEGWGVIDAVGREVSGLSEGDRVAALSSHAYAEYDRVEAASVVKLGPALEGKPFPGEPLGCAFNVCRRSDFQPGQFVAFIGIGFIGAVLTQLAVKAGAKVIAISRRPYALALRCGAWRAVPMADHHRIISQVKQLTEGALCDRVVEAVGLQWPLDLAGELARERGRLIIAGYHQDSPRQVNLQLWNWRGLDVINAHERDPVVYREGIELAAEAVGSGRLDPSFLFTHTYGLDQIGSAFEAMREKPEGFLKALVTL